MAVQLLLRRNPSAVVLMAIDHDEQESLYKALKKHAPPSTRFVGIRRLDDEGELVRLDALGLDGVLQRPLAETDLRATVNHLLRSESLAGVS